MNDYLLKTSLDTDLRRADMKYDPIEHYLSLTIDGKSKAIKHMMIDAGSTQSSIAKATGVAQGDLSKLLALEGAHKTLDKVLEHLYKAIKKQP